MHARGRHSAGASANLAAALPVLGLAFALMLRYAPPAVVALFSLFLIFGVTLPGLVIWRGIGRYRRNLVEDLSAAFAIGTAAQLIVYLASASVGLQRWSWVWAVPVLLVGLLDRDLRYAVLCRVESPLRPVTAWLVSGATALVLVAVFRHGPDQYAPPYTDPDVAYPDLAFHHALSVSAKYDVPLSSLWVAGEPMKYHHFFHQIAAATSWATGIDVQHLIYTVGWLPYVVAGCGLVFGLTDRFVRHSAWAGPLAVLVAGLGGTLQPLPEIALAGVSTATIAFLSPTQNLGGMDAVLLAILAVDVLRRDRAAPRWVLLIGMALAASGAKATVLPLVVCGFGLVFLLRLAARRWDWSAALGGLALTAIMVGSIVAVYAGQTSGLEIRPGDAFARLPPYPSLRSGMSLDSDAQFTTAWVTLLAWAIAAGGLLFVRRLLRDPGVGFLAGFSIAGFMAMLLTAQPGVSQMYFLRTAFPAIAVLSCVGLAQLVQRIGDRRAVAVVGLGAGLGTIACAVARAVSDGPVTDVKGPWLATGIALAGTALLVTVAWKVRRRAGRVTTVFAAALVAAGSVAAILVPVQSLTRGDPVANSLFGGRAAGGPTVQQADAARWLEQNSGREDLVATNAHCLFRSLVRCDPRHFWIAALSERQVLVEGWAYTNRINREAVAAATTPDKVPFWEPERLELNDEVFRQPSALLIARLRDGYGVRWLYADRLAGELSDQIGQFATERFRNDAVTIYELPTS